MRRPAPFDAQCGATLIVGLIMLLLITLMVSSAFMLSTTNLKSVGNMQFKDEAIAAANKAIEQVIDSDFASTTTSQTIEVDINNDGATDYIVTVAPPTCVRATVAGSSTRSSMTLGSSMSTSSTWNTVWDLDANVTDAKSGASVRVHSGVRALRSQTQKNAECA